jgi:hypothetical protein
LRVKAEKPQNPQVIFANARGRIAHKAHAPCHQVWQAAERVYHLTIGAGIKRIHGEIAPRGIFGQIVRKFDSGMTAMGLHIAPEGCDLKPFACDHHRDRAMFQPRGHGAQPCRLGQRDNRLGPRIGRDIDICDRNAHQRIAHATAHHIGLISGLFQQVQRLLRGRGFSPCAAYAHGPTLSASPRKMRAVAPQI